MTAYISELDYFGDSSAEFVEVAVPKGTDVSGYQLVFYQFDGTVYNSFGLGSLAATIAGHDVYVLDATVPGFANGDSMGNFYPDDAIALVDGSGTVLQFISWEGNTVTAAEGVAVGLTSLSAGTQSDSLQSDDGGFSYYGQAVSNEGSIPACYAPGTKIATPTGPRPVEALREGDQVMTLDQSPQPIEWIWNEPKPLEPQDADTGAVLIRAGALGRNRPAQDMIVSAQHRILVGANGQLEDSFSGACFVPAKALVGAPGCRRCPETAVSRWVHVALATHEVIWANGCLSESLFLGPVVLRGLTRRHRAELTRRFGAFTGEAALNGPLARPAVGVQRARRLLGCQGGGDSRRRAVAALP